MCKCYIQYGILCKQHTYTHTHTHTCTHTYTHTHTHTHTGCATDYPLLGTVTQTELIIFSNNAGS